MQQEFIALHQRWREKAELFREHGHEATARTYEVCSGELEAALRRVEDDLLDLQEAARAPGYSSDHLGRHVRAGKIPNAGRRNAPKIRRGDEAGDLPLGDLFRIVGEQGLFGPFLDLVEVLGWRVSAICHP